MSFIRIEAADDPRVCEFVSMRERDLVGRGNRFIVEGTVVLNALLDTGLDLKLAQEPASGQGSRFSIEKVFLLENRLKGLEPVLKRLDPAVPVYVADSEVMDKVVGFAMHRGVLALGAHAPLSGPDVLLSSLPEHALVVACCGIANHDNMGAIFRNAGVFGADAVLLDQTSCDPLYRKAIRVSVGAALRVPFCRGGTAAQLVDALRQNGFDLLGLSPRGDVAIEDFSPGPRVALIAGTEGEGLPVGLLERVRRVRIRQAPGLDSLNVATATGIALWHMAMSDGRLH